MKKNIVKPKWANDTTFSELYDVDSDTITIIYQQDKNPRSEKYIKDHSQYQHGRVSVFGEKSTAGAIYHVVNSEHTYNDAMLVEYMPGVNNNVHGMIGFDYVRYHKFLQTLVDN